MRALILGASGQDGPYLAEELSAAGHEVVAPARHLRLRLADLLGASRPDVVFNLAAVTAPGGAWGTDQPPGLPDVTALGVVQLMDAMRGTVPRARLVHASSSAVYDPHRYGLYGISKRFAHDAVVGYRNGYGMHASNAVLYSHTSPRQDGRFLAPKIARQVAAISSGMQGPDEPLVLTDLLGRRDWGYAPDHMRALLLIAEQDEPGDYDVATGSTHSVREFVDIALDAAGLTWAAVQVIPGNPAPPERPADVGPLRALGWQPLTPFEDMVRLMVKTASTGGLE